MDMEALNKTLSDLADTDRYRVEKMLKSNEYEKTELVYLIGADGRQTGPFVRKTFASESGLGKAYERIHEAQVSGMRASCLPNVIDVYSRGDERYAVMEYLRGRTFRECPKEERLSNFRGVCEAVELMHKRFNPAIIHRDIKPDNVMLCDGQVVLIDFGASRTVSKDADFDTHPYATRAYAPPEQFGFGQTDERSDVYSLGMLLAFNILGIDPDDSLKRAIGEGESSVSRLGIGDRYAKIVCKACAFDPKDRYQSVGRMIEDLDKPAPPSTRPIITDSILVTARPHVVSTRVQPATVVNPAKTARMPAASEQAPMPKRKGSLAWDIAVGVVWLFFLLVSTVSIIDPRDQYVLHPVWFRMVEYYLVCMSLFSIVAAAILDYRPILAKFPKLRWVKRWKAVTVFAILFVIGVIVFAIGTSALVAAGVIPGKTG